MSEPYVGEIRMFGGNFAPLTWAFCNGQLLSIAEYETLFSLIGTTYGGDGQSTFALPNLQGRLAVGMGQGPGLSNYGLGQTGGSEEVTLLTTNMPSHMHTLQATTTNATLSSPTGNLTGAVTGNSAFLYTKPGSPGPTLGNLSTQACSNAGGSQPHENIMPLQCVSFIISLYGIYPSRN